MKLSLKHIFCFVLILSPRLFFSQTKIDSLLKLIKTDKEDSTKAIHLNMIAQEKWNLSSFDSCMILASAALKLSQQIYPTYKNGIATSYNILGNSYRVRGNYPKALAFFLDALKTYEKSGNKSGIATCLGNLGIVYHEQANYPKALEHYLNGLKISETLAERNQSPDELKKIKIGILAKLGNIGVVYKQLGDYPKALSFLFKALKISKELDNKNKITIQLLNIGNVYVNQGNYAMGLDYYLKSLKISEQIDDKTGVAVCLGNIGLVYEEQREYQKALLYYSRSTAIFVAIGAKRNLLTNFERLSTLYEKSTISLSDSIEGRVLNKEQMRIKSIFYYKKYIALRDSIFSEESKKQLVRKEMNYEFEKKELAAKSEQDKKDALANEKLKQKETERNYFIAGFTLVALLALFILRSYRQKQKVNLAIIEQKKMVDEKQKEILDSIHYAKRIQSALITRESYIDKTIQRLQKK